MSPDNPPNRDLYARLAVGNPGVTVTNVSTPGAATIPANTASCQATTYNTS